VTPAPDFACAHPGCEKRRERLDTKKPGATKAWSHGAHNKFEEGEAYFGCSLSAVELMQ
jgi:hypothetical protein